MSGERCGRTELLVGECACPEHRGEQAAAELGLDEPIATVGQAFRAQFPGECCGCSDGIRPGDVIARVADEPGSYVHTRRCRR